MSLEFSQNKRLKNPFKGVAVCIFNPTWFKFWLSLTFSWQIPFVLDQKDNRLGAGTSSSSSMLCSLNAGGFLLFCTCWESK